MAAWNGHLNPSLALYSAEDIENAFSGNSTCNKAEIVIEAVEAEMRSLSGEDEVRDRSALENARAATEAGHARLEQAKKTSAQAQADALQRSKTTAQRDKSGKKKRRCMCCGYVDDAESVKQYARAHRP